MIVRYEVLRYRRRHATDPHQFSEDVLELLASEAERACATQSQRQLALRECIKQQLEPRQLALVKAVYEDGAAIKDVALQIGRSPTGLYKSLARIRDRLANCVRNRRAEAAEGLS
jgi:RNA polymerase sigma-70 factor (ECF subfamily)